MGPLFIPKHSSPPPPARSTPEGQEPDRNDHDRPQLDDPQKKREKKHMLHHRYSLSTTDTTNYDAPNHNSALRKYVLLVQDCIAIKFTRPPSLEASEKYPESLGDIRFSGDYRCTTAIDGVAVFKSFLASNKKCYWNNELSQAISSLEYKGYVHPATILVTTSPRHMSVLRSAWSRRILRDPPGYRADFLGEIEELVAQPVQQGQFAPLSDSLCWAIAELTESGQEAFINSIQSKLHSSFPSISQPPKELIFQTLEKLIREQKIYQTSRGYYVVTPDVSSYINYSRSVTPAGNMYGRIYADPYEKQSRYSTPWSSTPSVTQDSLADELRRILTTTQNVQLKRHNSLKIIRNKHENYHIHHHPSMGARSLSFRLSKCNSMFESDKESDDNEEIEIDKTPTLENVTAENIKRPSLITRLFKFRCTSRQKESPQQPQQNLPQKKPRPHRRRPTGPTTPSKRSSSPSSSVSGIYASITHRENVTHKVKQRTTGSTSLYDLLSDHRWPQPDPIKQYDVKNDSSDVSH